MKKFIIQPQTYFQRNILSSPLISFFLVRISSDPNYYPHYMYVYSLDMRERKKDVHGRERERHIEKLMQQQELQHQQWFVIWA